MHKSIVKVLHLMKENPSTNLHPWPHYKHSPSKYIMKVWSERFPSLTFMGYFMLDNDIFLE